MMNLEIDLTGLEHKWGSENKCAVCGFDFDNQENEADDPDFEYGVPLHLFRGEGKDCQMMAFCWECAKIRMQKKALN